MQFLDLIHPALRLEERYCRARFGYRGSAFAATTLVRQTSQICLAEAFTSFATLLKYMHKRFHVTLLALFFGFLDGIDVQLCCCANVFSMII